MKFAIAETFQRSLARLTGREVEMGEQLPYSDFLVYDKASPRQFSPLRRFH
jgi:hypothetical protein